MARTERRIVIVGGVAGGASAATRARRLDEHARITIFERDEHVSFANCGLPYYIGGEIAEREELLVVTAELFERRFSIRVRTLHEVQEIDRVGKTVRVLNRATGTVFLESYDKLILAPGASPVVPQLGGTLPRNVFVLRNVADSDRIRQALVGPEAIRPFRSGEPVRAVVVGAGFIGLELVEQLHRRGVEVSLVEMADQVLPLLDSEMGNLLQREIEERGVCLELGAKVEGFESNGSGCVTGVRLTNGKRLEAELVFLGVGVSPSTHLAAAAGLAIGPHGAIESNDVGQTSDPDIYVAGDAGEYAYRPTGAKARVPLAGPANRAGRIAGEHAATGRAPTPMAPILGTAIVRVFRRVAASTGLTEKAAAKAGIRAASVAIAAGSHAGYYPGSEQLVLKLVYDPDTGKLLGAQAIGGEGVDKRIDVIAAALHFGGTVRDLAALDLAYAPPFGSAKDPVHVAANVACNVLDGNVALAPPGLAFDRQTAVVDVRTPAEVQNQPLPGCDQAQNIPLDELRHRLSELDPRRSTVLVCATGRRSYLAARILRQRGFREVKSLSGGVLLRAAALARAHDDR